MILLAKIELNLTNTKHKLKGGKTVAEKQDKISLPGMAKIIQKLKDDAIPGHCRLGILIGEKNGDVVTIKDVFVPKEQEITLDSAKIFSAIRAAIGKDLLTVVGSIFFQPHIGAYETVKIRLFRGQLMSAGRPDISFVVGKNDEVFVVGDSNLSIVVEA